MRNRPLGRTGLFVIETSRSETSYGAVLACPLRGTRWSEYGSVSN